MIHGTTLTMRVTETNGTYTKRVYKFVKGQLVCYLKTFKSSVVVKKILRKKAELWQNVRFFVSDMAEIFVLFEVPDSEGKLIPCHIRIDPSTFVV